MKADHTQVAQLLKTARGQIDGILKMVEEDRYCMDVSTQISAAVAVLKRANRTVLRAHMDCCVRQAVADGTADSKLDELTALLDKLAE
ncbi:MAG: metal-sensing transcriptional repressor [Oscillospiraceae bacterium]|nr:metal-sensing transcriptional repressor [Oscillospiraceae bacterium]